MRVGVVISADSGVLNFGMCMINMKFLVSVTLDFRRLAEYETSFRVSSSRWCL